MNVSSNRFSCKTKTTTISTTAAIKKSQNDNLSLSLKKNLKLRKKQVLERDNKNIIGKRTTKIGLSRLNLDDHKIKHSLNNE